MLEILKANGIEEEQANSIVKAMNEAKIYTTKLENIDDRYAKLKGQKEELDKMVKERDVQLSDLSKNNKDNAELQKMLDDLQVSNKNQIADYEAKISKMEFDNALDKTLSSAKCKNNKALKALLDIEGIKYQDGKLEGLEGQLENLKKEASYLFEDVQSGGSGFNPGGATTGITKEQFRSMDYTKRMELYNSNEELYNKLNNE